MEAKSRNTTADDKSITDIPIEVIEKCFMVYLSVNDLRSFGTIGNERFKQMAEDVIEKRRELIY